MADGGEGGEQAWRDKAPRNAEPKKKPKQPKRYRCTGCDATAVRASTLCYPVPIE